MYNTLRKARSLVTSAAVVGCLAFPALAEEREFSFSATATGTSDYVFRGVSQTDEKPGSPARPRCDLRHPVCRHLGVQR